MPKLLDQSTLGLPNVLMNLVIGQAEFGLQSGQIVNRWNGSTRLSTS